MNNKEIPIPPLAKRINDLRKSDHPYEDSAQEIAKKEDLYRKKLKKKEINLEDRNELADDYSTETLETLEANKGALLDKLTGVGNRGFLEEAMPKLLSFEKRENQNCSVIMLDIDHFKDINDTHGHATGDEVLKKIITKIKKTVRKSDFIFRYGGEEFIVFCPNTNVAQAEIIAEKIRSAIEEAKIYNKTISLGCMSTSEIENWGEELDKTKKELVEKADDALYYSKEHDRNKVTPHNKEVEKFVRERKIIKK